VLVSPVNAKAKQKAQLHGSTPFLPNRYIPPQFAHPVPRKAAAASQSAGVFPDLSYNCYESYTTTYVCPGFYNGNTTIYSFDLSTPGSLPDKNSG
jgi:hypothetical protein